MSRSVRTKQFKDKVKKQWKQKYWSFIKENLDKDLYWGALSRHPYIDMDIISNNIDLPWDWRDASENINLTY